MLTSDAAAEVKMEVRSIYVYLHTQFQAPSFKNN